MSDRLLAQRLAAQRLSGEPLADPAAVARHLLAVQAQDGRGARLAVRARTTRPGAAGTAGAADVDRALTDERSLVISWYCRGTLHLVAREDHHWLHALTTPPLATGNARRLAQEGVPPDDADRAVAAIERALAEEGPLTRIELRERVDAIGVRTAEQALVHILFLCVLRGLVVRGPVIGRQHAYVLVRDWLGEPPRPLPDRSVMLAELARRYLTGHGPAADVDLARWAGLPLRDARAGLEAIAVELVERPGGQVALREADAAPAPGLPAPRLLGSWDALQVGWKDRSFVNGPDDGALISGGLFRPFALVGGRSVATWRIRDGAVALDEPFRPVSARDRAALRRDADDVEAYLGRSIS